MSPLVVLRVQATGWVVSIPSSAADATDWDRRKAAIVVMRGRRILLGFSERIGL